MLNILFHFMNICIILFFICNVKIINIYHQYIGGSLDYKVGGGHIPRPLCCSAPTYNTYYNILYQEGYLYGQ